MKVLRLWHAAVVPEYRKKIRAIADLPDIELHLLIPPSWQEGTQKVRYLHDPGIDAGYQIRKGHVIHLNNIRRYRFINGLRSALMQFKPDIVDMEEEPFSAVVRQMMQYCKWFNLHPKFIFHSAHNIHTPIKGRFGRYERYAIKHGHGAVARNREAEERIRALGFTNPIARIGNGIDLTRFTTDGSRQIDPQIGIQGKRVVGYVGKLRTGKGVMDLVRAFSMMPSDVHLLLVGDGHLRGEIERFVLETPKLKDRIWITGAVPHTEVANYYRAMDVCVLPSRTEKNWKESFGRVLIESMACGIPVIGSNSGAIPDTISQAGLIFPERDYKALSVQLQRLLDHPQLYHTLRREGLSHCRQFSWSGIAQKHQHLYHQLMQINSSRAFDFH